ncbi:hypothetical protein 3 [Culex tritaeniorhynchus Anphevirus]|uniref:Uncharacterized protein n=1 Tax=Culex tritaeniorhynchus Anphevirus TaxID=2684266 RepID=A0AAD1GVQ3_9MONO|nr:hypothetical protein 3 [Culex tritaeniorhynchus Anphevirus]BBQ04820.1 hypothetical protein 3 [Culex tritaeniorhynchus Anphevirus]
MSQKNNKGQEEVLTIKNVITFQEFLEWLPINSIQSNTWLSYNVLWYASRCLIHIREASNWHNLHCVFSSRLVRSAEFVLFSEVATQAWCPEHIRVFKGIQFNAITANLDAFQTQAAQIGGFQLNQPDVAPFLNWERETPEWPTLFAQRIAQLYSLAQQVSNQGHPGSNVQFPIPTSHANPFGSNEDTYPLIPDDEFGYEAGGEDDVGQQGYNGDRSRFDELQDELADKCMSACDMINNLARNMQKLSKISNGVAKAIETGFEALQEAQYRPHGKLAKLLIDNWGYLPPTLQLATPRSIVDVVTKSQDYVRYMRTGSEREQIHAVEFIWNTYLVRAIQESGNVDEDATKIKSVNVEELSSVVARRTLAESGIDASLPSMIRKIGDELRLMNVQSISKGKDSGNAVNIPGAAVAQNSEEAKRLLAGKKKQEVQNEIKNNDAAIARYLGMSEYEVFLLSYEEQQLAREIRRSNP